MGRRQKGGRQGRRRRRAEERKIKEEKKRELWEDRTTCYEKAKAKRSAELRARLYGDTNHTMITATDSAACAFCS